MDYKLLNIEKFYNSYLGDTVLHHTEKLISNISQLENIQNTCGIGFTTPFLKLIKRKNMRMNIYDCRPDFLEDFSQHQKEINSKSVHEYFIPHDHSSMECVFVSHLLELVEKPLSIIEESWRLLKPNGILITIVPRRSGLWTRYDNNPFGYGRSFSSMQLNYLTKEFFKISDHQNYLFSPPFEKIFLIKFHNLLETYFKSFFPFWGGLKLSIMKKITYASVKKNKEKLFRKRKLVVI